MFYLVAVKYLQVSHKEAFAMILQNLDSITKSDIINVFITNLDIIYVLH